MSNFNLTAQERADLGKGASRRLRRNANQVPAIVYGGDTAPQSITLAGNEVAKLLNNEAAFSNVITLDIAGNSESVLIKAVQRHPSKGHAMHIDFLRALADHKLSAHVPLHFLNEESAIGVKQQGGDIQHNATEVEVSCLPKDLPEFIEVDLAAVEVGTTLHMTDLKLPAGVSLVSLSHGSDLPIVSINKPRGEAADEETSAE